MPTCKSATFTAVVSLLMAGLADAAQTPTPPRLGPDSPEPVVRSFYKAILTGDVAAYHRVIVADAVADKFLPPEPPSKEKAEEIAMQSIDFHMRQTQPFRWHGRDVDPDATGHYPPGTTTRYLANFPRSLTVVSVVRQPDGWRVDMRWWDAIAALTEEGPPRGSPEYVVKMLTAALVTLHRDEAMKVIVPDGKMDVLFAGAPRSPEPSGQMIALVGEMPVVEIGPGEFVQMPSGAVVEGVHEPDKKVLVGIYGPNELPFVVEKVGGEWRVTVEPYFSVLDW
jgi:hypothetical protein